LGPQVNLVSIPMCCCCSVRRRENWYALLVAQCYSVALLSLFNFLLLVTLLLWLSSKFRSIPSHLYLVIHLLFFPFFSAYNFNFAYADQVRLVQPVYNFQHICCGLLVTFGIIGAGCGIKDWYDGERWDTLCVLNNFLTAQLLLLIQLYSWCFQATDRREEGMVEEEA